MSQRMRWRIQTSETEDGPIYDVYEGAVLGCVYNHEKQQTCLVLKGVDGYVHEVAISEFEPF